MQYHWRKKTKRIKYSTCHRKDSASCHWFLGNMSVVVEVIAFNVKHEPKCSFIRKRVVQRQFFYCIGAFVFVKAFDDLSFVWQPFCEPESSFHDSVCNFVSNTDSVFNRIGWAEEVVDVEVLTSHVSWIFWDFPLFLCFCNGTMNSMTRDTCWRFCTKHMWRHAKVLRWFGVVSIFPPQESEHLLIAWLNTHSTVHALYICDQSNFLRSESQKYSN